jgi:hypothetical protein
MGRITGVGTAVDQEPHTLFFTEPVGQTSAPKTIKVTNTASYALYVASVSLTGDYAQTNNCGNQIPIGGQCSIFVTFTPTKKGPSKGEIHINDADLNSPQKVTLSGTGT